MKRLLFILLLGCAAAPAPPRPSVTCVVVDLHDCLQAERGMECAATQTVVPCADEPQLPPRSGPDGYITNWCAVPERWRPSDVTWCPDAGTCEGGGR